MVYVFLANGFEETEALVTVDVLRRAGYEVKTVGVGGEYIAGSHNITVKTDVLEENITPCDELEAVILPGGMPGTLGLKASEKVAEFILFADENKRVIGAICAAPFILGRKGILNGKKATCFPGFENELIGAIVLEDGVVSDGNIVTAKGAGVAWEFGAAIATLTSGKEKADSILRGIQWKK